jgi:dipeptidase D
MQTPSFYPPNPQKLWSYFHQLTQIPRPSKQEEKVRDFILIEANKLELKTHIDQVGNIIVYVPGSLGYENHETVIIQNHMDMVTDATPERKINFSSDPIIVFKEGDWIRADRTTLGADNGIGCAAALALMNDSAIPHPPLELLFTVDEETGLKGAWGVEGSQFNGKKMLNLDTEEWGNFYIGCAGGVDYDFNRIVRMIPSKLEGSFYQLKVGGLLGGHSGIDIHEQRGNAIKFLMEILDSFPTESFEIVEFRGGKAHNIIPRDAYAVIKLQSSGLVLELVDKKLKKWKSYLPQNDQGLFVHLEQIDSDFDQVVHPLDLRNVLDFLLAFPHGAHSYELESSKQLVSLSNNLAISLLVKGHFYLQSSLRFFDRGECEGLETQITSLARGFQMDFKKNGEYPSWKPIRENKLLDLVCEKYEFLFNREAKVMAIHAGLECGILKEKIGKIDVVSFGPTILGAHSPQEKVHIPTVETFWVLLLEVLKSL